MALMGWVGGTSTGRPLAAFAITIGYHLQGKPQLIFDMPTLAKIYMGHISWWNDSTIQTYALRSLDSLLIYYSPLVRLVRERVRERE